MSARLTDRARYVRSIQEKTVQGQIEEHLALYRWDWVYHTHDSRRSQRGLPDLLAIRGPRKVWLEVKRVGERPTADQVMVMTLLHDAGDEVYLVDYEAGGSSSLNMRKFGNSNDWRVGMGVDWMSNDELAESIPPAYTEFIGRRLAEVLG